MTATAQTQLDLGEYGCISADPPWLERGGGKCKRGADRHYPLLNKYDILGAMLSAPCWRPAATSHLWLWVTNNYLEDGLWLLRQLGYRYVTKRTWVKMEPLYVDSCGCLSTAKYAEPGSRVVYQLQHHGLGQYLWGEDEPLLLGVRGDCAKPEPADRPGTFLGAPRGRHSEKPAQAYKDMERVSPGPYLEMFARAPREGWDVWGNEV